MSHAKTTTVNGFLNQFQAAASIDNAVAAMPQVRVNANGTMARIEQKQEEENYSKQRVNKVDVDQYLNRAKNHHEDEEPDYKEPSGIYKPASASFKFKRQSQHIRSATSQLVRRPKFSDADDLNTSLNTFVSPLAITTGAD